MTRTQSNFWMPPNTHKKKAHQQQQEQPQPTTMRRTRHKMKVVDGKKRKRKSNKVMAKKWTRTLNTNWKLKHNMDR
jgi:hypothetical protein